MYIESKGGGFTDKGGWTESESDSLTGPARIGRVTFSKTGSTMYYKGRSFQSLNGSGFKANYFDIESGEQYWISGPKKNGQDALYATNIPTQIDDDVREEYWIEIRKLPERKAQKHTYDRDDR